MQKHFFLYVLYKMFVQYCYEILVVLLKSKVFCQRKGQVKLSELKNSCCTCWQYFIVCVLLAFCWIWLSSLRNNPIS